MFRLTLPAGGLTPAAVAVLAADLDDAPAVSPMRPPVRARRDDRATPVRSDGDRTRRARDLAVSRRAARRGVAA